MKKILFALLAGCTLAGLSSLAFAADAHKLEGPYIVTTCGQSPGAVMIRMSAMQSGIKADHDNGLTAEKLKALPAGEYKTLIVTSGTSMKGMGAAGTNVDAEIARCNALMDEARSLNMTIIGSHVEGMARRTDNSDEASINAVMAKADVILVVDDSDSDGFFTKYAEEHKKPMLKVKDALNIGSVLK